MINLPWPPKQLSPNARVHWKMKSAFAKRYRNTCKVICLSEKLTAPKTEGKLHLWITFFPPDKRKRDDDNMIASFKAGRDGIADALGIDDSLFVTHPFVSHEKGEDFVKGGHVKVVITEGPNDV